MRTRQGYIKMETVLRVRVSKNMKDKLTAAALASGKSISDVIRMSIVGIRIPNKTTTIMISQLLQLKSELRRQGGLLKHCINTVNAIGITPEVRSELKRVINAYDKLARDATSLFQKIH